MEQAEQSSLVQVEHTRAEQGCLAPGPPHSRVVPQPCYIIFELFALKFPSHHTPNWGFLLALNWHQQPLVDNPIEEVLLPYCPASTSLISPPKTFTFYYVILPSVQGVAPTTLYNGILRSTLPKIHE